MVKEVLYVDFGNGKKQPLFVVTDGQKSTKFVKRSFFFFFPY